MDISIMSCPCLVNLFGDLYILCSGCQNIGKVIQNIPNMV